MPDSSKYQIGVEIGATGAENFKKQVDESVKSLDGMKKAFVQLPKVNLGDKINGVPELKKQVDATDGALVKLGKSFNKLPPGANAASNALVNLGRVTQDAPFGFIGIANNLNPLLESFQRLKAEAGSSGKALKLLGSSLIGAGGVGLALSAVTFIAAGGIDTIKKFFSQFSDANQNITQAKKFLDELKSSMDIRFEAQGSAQGEIAEVTALAAVVRDEAAAKDERLAAIQRLKAINKSYFGDLDLEKASVAKLAKIQEDYTNALIAQSVIKGFSDEVGKSSVELFRQEKALKAAGIALFNAQVQASKAQEAFGNLNITDINATSGDKLAKANTEVEKTTKTYQQQLGIVTKLRDVNSEYGDEINKAVSASLKLKPLTTDNNGDGAKSALDLLNKQLARLKQIQKVQQEIVDTPTIDKKLVNINTSGFTDSEIENITGEKRIQQAFKDVQALIQTSEKIYNLEVKKIDLDVKKGVISASDASKAKKIVLDELNKAYTAEAIVFEGTVRVKPTIIVEKADLSKSPETIESDVAKSVGLDKTINLPVNANILLQIKGGNERAALDEIEKRRKALESRLASIDTELFFKNLSGPKNAAKAAIAAEEIALDFEVALNNAFGNISIDAFSSIGEGLGNALSGGGLNDLVKPLLTTISDALVQLGKATIKFGVQMLAIKKGLNLAFKNPTTAILAGIAAVAAGTLLKNAFTGQRLPKFEGGGIATGPNSGYTALLHGTEAIVPLKNNRFPFGVGGSDSGGIGNIVGVIRGKDLNLINRRAEKSRRRI